MIADLATAKAQARRLAVQWGGTWSVFAAPYGYFATRGPMLTHRPPWHFRKVGAWNSPAFYEPTTWREAEP